MQVQQIPVRIKSISRSRVPGMEFLYKEGLSGCHLHIIVMYTVKGKAVFSPKQHSVNHPPIQRVPAVHSLG
jgi:hypothetical protein